MEGCTDFYGLGNNTLTLQTLRWCTWSRIPHGARQCLTLCGKRMKDSTDSSPHLLDIVHPYQVSVCVTITVIKQEGEDNSQKSLISL